MATPCDEVGQKTKGREDLAWKLGNVENVENVNEETNQKMKNA